MSTSRERVAWEDYYAVVKFGERRKSYIPGANEKLVQTENVKELNGRLRKIPWVTKFEEKHAGSVIKLIVYDSGPGEIPSTYTNVTFLLVDDEKKRFYYRKRTPARSLNSEFPQFIKELEIWMIERGCTRTKFIGDVIGCVECNEIGRGLKAKAQKSATRTKADVNSEDSKTDLTQPQKTIPKQRRGSQSSDVSVAARLRASTMTNTPSPRKEASKKYKTWPMTTPKKASVVVDSTKESATDPTLSPTKSFTRKVSNLLSQKKTQLSTNSVDSSSGSLSR